VRHQGFVIEQERINFDDEASANRPSPQVPRVALATGHDHGSGR